MHKTALPEFSRKINVREIGRGKTSLTATPQECTQLAMRFELAGIRSLSAEMTLVRDADIIFAKGRLKARIRQICSITGEEFGTNIAEDLDIRFEPKPEATEKVTADEEVELTERDFDTEYYTGAKIDLGEAVAQSLAVGIDPYPRGPDADNAEARAKLSTPEENGPFAALKKLKT